MPIVHLAAIILFVFSLDWMNNSTTAGQVVFAGVAAMNNELYFQDRTFMLCGEANAVVGELTKRLAGNGTFQ